MLFRQCVSQTCLSDNNLKKDGVTFNTSFSSSSFLLMALCALRKTKASVNQAFVNPVYGNWRDPEKTEVSANGELYCFRSRNTHTQGHLDMFPHHG